ncbi:M14 family zinc carboxypeptidase [Alteromonas lipolytica]|uniref:Peptidase M14 domain-containing protein n=1 Tax=Alteromonas lipolytica TaxID=1856405 RepID=A0A1E8F9H3_9ALTE|nr:M14 family zinc carboxypeptidase [Alteromonas lipolytica]OFI32436.1 hypothetical protein BFC17_06900 [Alteromonas lipolytica]GGF79674.1 hypothetical protein GCM10011338_35020 [Alteromonas lipolytica]
MKAAHPHLPAQTIASLWQAHHFSDLNKPHLRPDDIRPVLEKLGEYADIDKRVIGHSCTGRPIERLTLGHGPMVVLAWTQMHGDEPTATAAVLDWLEMLMVNNTSNELALPDHWHSLVTLHIIPMLNPDGAQRMTRVNEQGIDINRDARQLQSPEGKLLWQQVLELKPDIAFNLHDQNPYYTAGNTAYPATIAFLAPAFHPDKHVDAPRLRAKQLIACMADTLSHWLPCHIGRYDDTYSLRSFGDNIAGTGASTILIESGAYPNDPHRQVARKMNVIALQSALEALLGNLFQQKSLADYYRIPDNVEDGLVDIKFSQVRQQLGSTDYIADISVNIDKAGRASIRHIGDLSAQAGFTQISAYHTSVNPLKGITLDGPLVLDEKRYKALLREGFCYFVGDAKLLDNQSGLPCLCVAAPLSYTNLFVGADAYWVMTDNEGAKRAVLNGLTVPL